MADDNVDDGLMEFELYVLFKVRGTSLFEARETVNGFLRHAEKMVDVGDSELSFSRAKTTDGVVK